MSFTYQQISNSNSWMAKMIKAALDKTLEKQGEAKGMTPEITAAKVMSYTFTDPAKSQARTETRLRRAERNVPYMRRGSLVSTTSGYRTVATDAITSDGIIDVTSSGVLKAGSGSPIVTEAGFSYVADGTSITWYWDGTNSSKRIILRRADNTKQPIPKGSMTVTGLSNGTTYYFLPFWSVSAEVLGWVIGTVGSPKIAFTVNTSNDALQQQNLQDREPLTTNFMSAVTTAGAPAPPAGGGGGGGGDPDCPAIEMYLDHEMQAGNCYVGRDVQCLTEDRKDIELKPVLATRLARADCWRYKAANGAERIDSESTPIPTMEDKALFVCELEPGMHVITDVGNGLEWSELVEVEYLGARPVAHIYCGGRNFAAGTVPGKFIYSHNNRIAKP